MNQSVTIEPIGRISTAHTDRASTPVQTVLNPDERGIALPHGRSRDGPGGLGASAAGG